MKTSFINLDNTRLEEQQRVMEEILRQGHCPFCEENLLKYHKQPILKESTHWRLTYNQWPYENTRLHLLAIYKAHAVALHEITPAAGQELIELLQWAEKEFDVPGGSFAMRFGDTDYSAGTVNHIHAQFIVPELNAPTYQPVRFKIGKSPA
jgi:diadenosine tetraphosphate (Ap4A) HIT family hydrolase